MGLGHWSSVIDHRAVCALAEARWGAPTDLADPIREHHDHQLPDLAEVLRAFSARFGA